MKYFVEQSDERNRFLNALIKTEYDILPELRLAKSGDVLIFSPSKRWADGDATLIPNGVIVFSGKLPSEIAAEFAAKNVKRYDFMSDEAFAVKNANLTAEGILALALESCPKSVFDTKILLLGGGRVAKAAALLFLRLGIKTTMCEFDNNNRASCFLVGADVIGGEELSKKLSRFDVIINTIPAPVLTQNVARNILRDTALIEVASVSCLENQNVDFRYIKASGLPQKYCPQAAAELMLSFIKDRIKDD